MEHESLLTILAALELTAVLLLQGQFSLQLGNATLGKLPAQLLVLLDQHPTLGHQLLPCLAAMEMQILKLDDVGKKKYSQLIHAYFYSGTFS